MLERPAEATVDYMWWARRGSAGKPDEWGLVAPWTLGRHSLAPGARERDQVLAWQARGYYRWGMLPALALMREQPACVTDFCSHRLDERVCLIRSYRLGVTEGEVAYQALFWGLTPHVMRSMGRELRWRGAKWYGRLIDWPDP